MPTEFIEFLQTYTVKDQSGTMYEKGTVHQLSSASCRHFVMRGVARYVSMDIPGPVHTGGGWYELPNGEKIKGKDAAMEAMLEYRKSKPETLDDEPGPDAGAGRTLESPDMTAKDIDHEGISERIFSDG